MARACKLAVFRDLGGVAPTLSGTQAVESTLTATGGSGAYQWQQFEPSNDTWTNISGETSSTYVIAGEYGSRLLRCVRGGVASSATGAIDPLTQWSYGMEDNNINADTGWDADSSAGNGLEDSDGTADSVISTDFAHTGTYSLKQNSDPTGNGSRMYRWPEMDVAYQRASRTFWRSYWFYLPAIIYKDVGAGDWGGCFDQMKSYKDATNIDGLWFTEFTEGSAGAMHPQLTWWPGSNFSDAPYEGGGAGGHGWTNNSFTIPIGQWNYYELELVGSTDTGSGNNPLLYTYNFDGRIRWWVNGTLLFDSSAFTEVTSGSKTGIITKYGQDVDAHPGQVQIATHMYTQCTSPDPALIYKDDFKDSYGRQTYYADQ